MTDEGKMLMESALNMESSAQQFERRVKGMEHDVSGSIRISVSEVVGHYFLPQALKALARHYPELAFEIVISNTLSNLSKREADIALRMVKPTQLDLVARRLADIQLAFFAHQDYLERKGIPQSLMDLKEHDLVGYDQEQTFVEAAGKMGFEMTNDQFRFRSDHLLTQINLIEQGMGIGVSHVGLMAFFPQWVRLFPDLEMPPLQHWCVCHGDIQYSRKIQLVMRFLGDYFSANNRKF